MGIYIRDKDIDRRLEELVRKIRKDYGIKNASKTDAIRFLLELKKQGKKTDTKWKKLF